MRCKRTSYLLEHCEHCGGILGGFSALLLRRFMLQQNPAWRHIKSIHEGLKYRCEQEWCDFEDVKKETVRDHRRAFKCDECENETSKPQKVRNPIKVKHSLWIQYLCNQCDYQTATMKYLKAHITTKHEPGQQSCNSCDYVVQTQVHLNHTKRKYMKMDKHYFLCD